MILNGAYTYYIIIYIYFTESTTSPSFACFSHLSESEDICTKTTADHTNLDMAVFEHGW